MKIWLKIKKAFLSIMAAIMLIPGKIWASVPPKGIEQRPLYGGPSPGLGRRPIFEPHPVIIAWKWFRIIAVPLILIIGIIIYLKNSKSSIKRKIISIVIAIILVILLCLGITYVLNLLFKDVIVGYIW